MSKYNALIDDATKLNEKELKKIIPAKRFGEAEEVAHVVSFLVSKKYFKQITFKQYVKKF